MIPTRKDHPEARKAKIEMINQIVSAKLGIQGASKPDTQQPAQKGGVVEWGSLR
jgi:hypothetical protein